MASDAREWTRNIRGQLKSPYMASLARKTRAGKSQLPSEARAHNYEDQQRRARSSTFSSWRQAHELPSDEARLRPA